MSLEPATPELERITDLWFANATKVGEGGRDQKERTAYSALKKIAVWQIKNPALTQIYNANRSRLASKDCISERLLVHCPSNQALFSIVHNGFDPAYSEHGAYGAGVYFADDLGKSDQYAEMHTAGPFKDHYTMLLCKVMLGCTANWTTDCYQGACFVSRRRRALVEPYDSITFNAAQHGKQTKRPFRFNEYVLLAKNGTDGALPIALIVYKRVMTQSLNSFLDLNIIGV